MLRRNLIALAALAFAATTATAAPREIVPLSATVTFAKGGVTRTVSELRFQDGKAVKARNGAAVRLEGTGGARSKAFVGDLFVMNTRIKGEDMLLTLKLVSTDLEKATVQRAGGVAEIQSPRQVRSEAKVMARRESGGWSYVIPESPQSPQVSIRIAR